MEKSQREEKRQRGMQTESDREIGDRDEEKQKWEDKTGKERYGEKTEIVRRRERERRKRQRQGGQWKETPVGKEPEGTGCDTHLPSRVETTWTPTTCSAAASAQAAASRATRCPPTAPVASAEL